MIVDTRGYHKPRPFEVFNEKAVFPSRRSAEIEQPVGDALRRFALSVRRRRGARQRCEIAADQDARGVRDPCDKDHKHERQPGRWLERRKVILKPELDSIIVSWKSRCQDGRQQSGALNKPPHASVCESAVDAFAGQPPKPEVEPVAEASASDRGGILVYFAVLGLLKAP